MINRRHLLKSLAATGIGSAVFHRAVVALADDKQELSMELLTQAAWVTEMDLTGEQAGKILKGVKDTSQKLAELRKIEIGHDVGPAVHFRPLLARRVNANVNITRNATPIESAVGQLPDSDEGIAFLPVTELSGFIRRRQLTSKRLSEIYLARLKKYGPMLRCVVNLTEELAMKQADRADKEIAAGRYRGPLQGIPWGAKDLVSVPGYPTTWGIPYFKDRVLDDTATVAARLEQAGAVLVAKTSLGALAMGDLWFEGMTRNPWNPKTGSSGSSAGSSAGTVAGLFGFSIGSETLGSITSPARVCGASGFRPTFGRVSRHGCMPLSWTMDKIGPICRSAEDCALVFDAIHGSDGMDATVYDYNFQWPPKIEVRGLRVGYSKGRRPVEERPDLQVLKDLGCELIEVNVPNDIPAQTLANIIDIEAASVFDQLLREGHNEGWNAWTDIFRSAQFISAIDYLRFLRLRTKLMHQFEKFMADVDVLCNVFDIYHTNLTGHPSIVIPRAVRDLDSGGRRPLAVAFTGHLNDDSRMLALAHAYQNRVDGHLQRPALEEWLAKFEAGELDEKTDEEVNQAEQGSQNQNQNQKNKNKNSKDGNVKP